MVVIEYYVSFATAHVCSFVEALQPLRLGFTFICIFVHNSNTPL